MVFTRSGLLGVMMVASLFLAGCAGTSDPGARPNSLDQQQLVAEGTGGIIGQVINTEQLPVPDATVIIDAFPPIKTDASGLFAVRGLQPGEHVIAVSAVAHADLSRTITLAAGEVLQLQVSMERLAGQEPYPETLIYRGYSICDIIVYANWQTALENQCNDTPLGQGKKDNKFNVTIPGSWRYIISEAVWTPQTGAGGDSMRIEHAPANKTNCSGGDPCYGEVAGQDSYARLEADPGKTEIALFYDAWSAGNWLPYPEEEFNLGIWVQWTGLLRKETKHSCEFWDRGFYTGAGSWHKQDCWGFGVSTGIPFDLWITIFHWQPPPMVYPCCPRSDFTAREDA